MEKYNLNSIQLMSTPHYSLRKNHTWSSSWIKQARIQRFKEVTQTDQFQDFPSQLPGYQDLSPLSFVLSYQLQYIDWVFISAESVEDCISVKRLNTLNTDLQSILQNINKFAAGQTRLILTNTRSSRSHEFCCEFCRIFQNIFFA